MKNRELVLLCAALVLAMLGSCGGGTTDVRLDEARFLMDQCNPSVEATLTKCTAAEAKTLAIQVGDPINLDAAVIKSSANLGLAGFTSLGLASELLGLQGDSENDFIQFHNYVNSLVITNGRDIDLDRLHTSITALTDVLDGTATEDNKHAYFQLGILQAIDSFIRPTQLAGTAAINANLITDDAHAIVLADFINADNNLELSDTDESDFLTPIRKNYCLCSLQTPLGAPPGFTAACLRDLMRCSLSGSAVPEHDYDENGVLNLDDCDNVRDPVGLDACQELDTAE